MVGHTGNFSAAVKACETVDKCTKAVVTEAIKNKYSVIIIADHGNSDMMINEDGSPNTAHTINPVPIIVIDENVAKVKDGILADIAPTILKFSQSGKVSYKYKSFDRNIIKAEVYESILYFLYEDSGKTLLRNGTEKIDLID